MLTKEQLMRKFGISSQDYDALAMSGRLPTGASAQNQSHIAPPPTSWIDPTKLQNASQDMLNYGAHWQLSPDGEGGGSYAPVANEGDRYGGVLGTLRNAMDEKQFWQFASIAAGGMYGGGTFDPSSSTYAGAGEVAGGGLGGSSIGAPTYIADAGVNSALTTVPSFEIAGGLTPELAGAGATGAGLAGSGSSIGAPAYVADAGVNAALTVPPAVNIGASTVSPFVSGLGSLATKLGTGAITSGLLGGLAGAANNGGSGGADTAGGTTNNTTTQTIDPRIADILFPNGGGGLLDKITGQLSTPEKGGLSSFGQASDNYLGTFGQGDLERMRMSAFDLQDKNQQAPNMGAASTMASTINAPSQNNLNLNQAYQDTIYGDPAQNPYLTGAIGKGINQSNTAFQNMLTDSTRNLTENILPSIRSGAQANGGYGGSRQAITEGRALNDYSTQIGRALSQYGQNNTDAAVGAQAGAYDAGKNRALSAMSGLSGNQYNVAGQNAGFQQQSNLTNAGFQQQANVNNQQSQQDTNRLNSANHIAGLGANSGLLGAAAGYATNNDAYGLNRVGRVAGMVQPFTGLGGSTSSTGTNTNYTPTYSNTAGNVIGGITAGLGLYNAANKSGLLDMFGTKNANYAGNELFNPNNYA